MNEKKKILILSANPKMTAPLRLDEEVRKIEEGLQLAVNRDEFDYIKLTAVKYADIRRGLLNHKPQIVHFTGHGESDGILVEGESGICERVSKNALSDLFQLLSKHVECVILNACYSAQQAKEIAKHIDYVIGMKKEILDQAAIEFTVGLYDALGAGWSMEEAFQFGRNAILQKFPEDTQHNIPILISQKQLKKKGVVITDSPDNTPITLIIRSFINSAHDVLVKQANQILCLSKHFQGRKLVNKSWADISQEIKEFISQNINAEKRYNLYLFLHSSLAFLVGRSIDPKCGAEINIFQQSSSKSFELWHLEQFDTFINNRMWTIEESATGNVGNELAAAISVTNPTQYDAEIFVKNQSMNISSLLHLQLGNPNPRAIKNVNQSYTAAYKAMLILRDKIRQMRGNKLHLFIAAPNVFTFILGQQSHLLKNITLYEYDFDSKEPGAYTPSITI